MSASIIFKRFENKFDISWKTKSPFFLVLNSGCNGPFRMKKNLSCCRRKKRKVSLKLWNRATQNVELRWGHVWDYYFVGKFSRNPLFTTAYKNEMAHLTLPKVKSWIRMCHVRIQRKPIFDSISLGSYRLSLIQLCMIILLCILYNL